VRRRADRNAIIGKAIAADGFSVAWFKTTSPVFLAYGFLNRSPQNSAP